MAPMLSRLVLSTLPPPMNCGHVPERIQHGLGGRGSAASGTASFTRKMRLAGLSLRLA